MSNRKLFSVFACIATIAVGTALAQRNPNQPRTPPQPREPLVQVLFDGQSFLGVYPVEITRENISQFGLREARGVGIGEVEPGSPAEKAGLKKNDVILKIDGETVTSARKLNRLVSEIAPDHVVRITISRAGAEQEVSVTLTRRQNRDVIVGPQFDTERLRGELDLFRDRMGELSRERAPMVMNFGGGRRIGIGTTHLSKQLADYFGAKNGVLVETVEESGPASKAGLRAGDVITDVDGAKVDDQDDLVREINRKEEGEITLTIIRNKSQQTIKVTPEKRRGEIWGGDLFRVGPKIGRMAMPKIAIRIPRIRVDPVIRVEPRIQVLRQRPLIEE